MIDLIKRIKELPTLTVQPDAGRDSFEVEEYVSLNSVLELVKLKEKEATN